MRRVILSLCSVLCSTVAYAQAGGAPGSADAAGVPPEPAPPDPADRYRGSNMVPPGAWRLMVSDLTIFRLNPIGLESRARIGLQKRLYESAKPISRNNFMFLGGFARINPATAILGVGGEIQPASIFNLRVSGEVQQFFGTFGFLQSFNTANANYSDQTLKDLRDDPVRSPQATHLLHAQIQPTLQLKFGPIALKSQLQLDYWVLGDVRDGETVAYEATYDTLLPDKGWTLATDTDLLYLGVPGLAVGVRHSYVRPFYKERHFLNATDFAGYRQANEHSRIGLFAAYTLKDLGPSKFNKPTLILIASFYTDHRYRLGVPDQLPAGGRNEDYVSRAFPYLLLGFAFESDLLGIR
ncbi:MAG: hypothetical protein SFX73_01285 [Kofleriaceae bacterium]|nr:hypothetical protein [Kofleriaceae bacterium]